MTSTTSDRHVEWWRELIDPLGRELDYYDPYVARDHLPYSEVLAAKAISRRYSGTLIFVIENKKWMLWTGAIFEEINDAEIASILHAYAEQYRLALEWLQAQSERGENKVDYEEIWKKHRRFRGRIHSDAGFQALLRQLSLVCGVSAKSLDASTAWLVCENGVLNLSEIMERRTVTLYPHDPSRLVSKKINANWDPPATSAAWQQYLDGSLPDKEVQRFIQRWLGQALRGKPVDKGLINLQGIKDSGKSVFLETTRDVFGGYGVNAKANAFLAKSGSDPQFELHELKGARLVTASEPGKGKHLNDELVKSLTGGDKQTTRTLYGKHVQWDPQCTVFIASNNPMKFDTADAAMLDRLKVIRFDQQFSRDPKAAAGTRANLGLRDDLVAEYDGIFRWIIQGLLDYAEQGLGEEPEAVRAASERMAEEIDNPLAWVKDMGYAECLESDPNTPAYKCIGVQDAFKAYGAWCLNEGHDSVQRNDFSEVLQRLYPKQRGQRGWVFKGLVQTAPFPTPKF